MTTNISPVRQGAAASNVPQAGAVVMRVRGDLAEVLLVTARRNSAEWIFPKGHVEPGESAEQAAVREAREEAGVIALPLAPLRALEFMSGDEPVHVQYFLLELQRSDDSNEGRSVRWCEVAEARRLLSFDDAKGILDEAARTFGKRQASYR